MPFVSHADHFKALLETIIASPHTHAKWLNTLSYLENCGARKIAIAEHPTLVKKEVLKHAAEEFRHAHHLKKEMVKLGIFFPDYALSSLLGGFFSRNYLNRLDLFTSRFLTPHFDTSLKAISYLLVTYAIELRAEELYPLYHDELKKQRSSVRVKSIFLEEKEHLAEMRAQLGCVPHGHNLANKIVAYEGELCLQWIKLLQKSLKDQ